MDTQATTIEGTSSLIDCACVIHGDVYSWTYVERLYNMLQRHMTKDIRFHVYTEKHRQVPSHMIKHDLPDWGINGARRSWWYKMQLFDTAHHAGPLLYFDLDTVIVDNIDWICNLSPNWFWGVRDFKYLWRPESYTINSSIMWWDTRKFDYVWQNFQSQNLQKILKQYRGDQDYISQTLDAQKVRFLDSERIKSWRWECLDRGSNFKKRFDKKVNGPTIIPNNANVLVFHGQPKPNEIQDSVILQHWR